MFWANFYAAVAFWSIALAGGFYWSRRYVRAIEARAGAEARIAELESRLTALELGAPNAADALGGGRPAHQLGERAVERSSA